MQRRLILLLFFFSGFSALIYQVAWARQATLIFGVSIYAYSMVLAAFMGGMALGSLLLRHHADRTKQPLRLYLRLQAGIALYGLCSPWLFTALHPLYAQLAPVVATNVTPQILPFTLGTLRFLLAGLILAPPTILMGATLPVMAAAITRRNVANAPTKGIINRIGSEIGQLYAADTLGAALGSALTGLLLLRLLGTWQTIWLAAAFNALCAIVAWWLNRKALPSPTTVNSSSPPSSKREGRMERSQPSFSRFVLIAYSLSGFVALGYEIVWARILAIFTLNAVFSFAIMLTAFLLGLTIGGWIGAEWVKRRHVTLWHFGALQLLVGLAALSTLFLFAQLPNLTLEKFFGVAVLRTFIAFEFVIGLLTLIVPTTLLGLLFPLVTTLYTGAEIATVGRRIGLLNAGNTAGAIGGALLTGFVIIPAIGLKGAIMLFAGLNLLIGVAAFWWLRSTDRAWWQVPAAGVTAGLLLVAFAPAGYYLGFREGPSDELVFYAEGVETTVAVFDVPAENFKVSFVNGRIEVPTDAISMRAFRLLGHLPPILQPNAENALMLSFGNGIATGSLNTHQIPHIDAVDLSAEQFAAADYYWIENYNVLASPRLQTHVEDARNYLLQTTDRYAIITTDATHPVNTSSWALFTAEFYQSVAGHLTDDGLFMQWMPFHNLRENEYKAILRTYQQVFPHATLWYTGGSHTLLLATPARLTEEILLSHLQMAAANSTVSDDLGPLTAIRNDWIMDEDTLRNYAGDGPLITDNNAYFLPYTTDTDQILAYMTALRTAR